MADEFERRLRDALQARAAQVQPDPRTWTTVQERRRRRQLVTWAWVAVATAALVGVAVLAVPGLIGQQNRVMLEPGPSPVAPAPTPTPAPTVTEPAVEPPGETEPQAQGAGYVVTDGTRILLTDAAGEPIATLSEGELPVQDFAVQPGSTPQDLTVVWRRGIDCGARLGWERYVDGEAAGGGDIPATCPGTPVFSPDARHLAWTEGDPADPAAFSLQTIGWDDGPVPEADAGFGLVTRDVFLLNVDDWVWTEGTETANAGFLALRGLVDGQPRGYLLPIERQGDGALAVPPGDPDPVEQSWFAYANSHANMGAAVGPEYLLTLEEGGPTLTVAGDGDRAVSISLPDELLATADPARVWVSAWGGEVLVGDGAGTAWRTRWDGETWAPFAPLPGSVRYAVPLGAAADPSALAPQEGLPEAVEATRQAIAAAARRADYDALAALMAPDFTSSFGAEPGPEAGIATLSELESRGERPLARLVALLRLPSTIVETDEGVIYVWPFAFDRDLESLSSAEREALLSVASETDIAFWTEAGGYLGWRVGIDEQGVWRFYVAGD